MEPDRIEQDGQGFELRFERTPEGYVVVIRREHDGAVHRVAFPDAVGFDPQDPRGSLIAGCAAALPRLPWPAITRH